MLAAILNIEPRVVTVCPLALAVRARRFSVRCYLTALHTRIIPK